MKANELKVTDLMVGDWVYDNDYPMQITEIKFRRRGEPPYKLIGSLKRDGLEMESISLDYIQPIPITKELLEKNGFVRENLITSYNHYTGIDNRVSLNDDFYYINSRNTWHVHVDSEDYCTIANCELTYLHELQNLLRICKIDFEFVV